VPLYSLFCCFKCHFTLYFVALSATLLFISGSILTFTCILANSTIRNKYTKLKLYIIIYPETVINNQYRNTLIIIIKTVTPLFLPDTWHNLYFIILVNNKDDAQFFFVYVYFNSLYVSSIHMLITRRINCINTTSGICHSM